MACDAFAVGLSVGGKTFEDPMVSVCSGVFVVVGDVEVFDEPQAASSSAPLATNTAARVRRRSEPVIPPPLISVPNEFNHTVEVGRGRPFESCQLTASLHLYRQVFEPMRLVGEQPQRVGRGHKRRVG